MILTILEGHLSDQRSDGSILDSWIKMRSEGGICM